MIDRRQFQFQTGSIKSSFSNPSSYPFFLFQFQTGSIKSPTPFFYRIRCTSRFNSKLVRLKVEAVRVAYIKLFVSIPNWFD